MRIVISETSVVTAQAQGAPGPWWTFPWSWWCGHVWWRWKKEQLKCRAKAILVPSSISSPIITLLHTCLCGCWEMGTTSPTSLLWTLMWEGPGRENGRQATSILLHHICPSLPPSALPLPSSLSSFLFSFLSFFLYFQTYCFTFLFKWTSVLLSWHYSVAYFW